MSDCASRFRRSSANLGPGFDTLAVGVRLYLRLRVCAVLDGPTNGLQFDCAARVSAGDNYVERSFRAVAEAEGTEFPSLSLQVEQRHPRAREASAAVPRRPWRGSSSTSASRVRARAAIC